MGYSNQGNNVKKSFAPLEEGYYDVTIKSFKEKEMKTSSGSYLEADLEIITEGSKGRRLWHKFMTGHSKSVVKKIGIQQLDALLKAVGFEEGTEGISDNSQLEDFIGKNLRVKVAIAESPGFGRQNKITSFYDIKPKRRNAA